MRRQWVLISGVAAICSVMLAGVTVARARTAAVAHVAGAHGFQRAMSVGEPGMASPDSAIESVSCTSPGNCGSGGYYRARSSGQAFVLSQVRGHWGKPMAVTGPAELNTGGDAAVESVSCSSAGNCGAGGWYLSGVSWQAFVVSEVNGRWHTAIEVRGTAALNPGGFAQVDTVSCASQGNCSAGGFVSSSQVDDTHLQQPFVVSEVNGRWHTAIEVPGMAALNLGSNSGVTSMSCGSPGNCSAGGWYANNDINQQAFVVNQVNGQWRQAIEVPGTSALNVNGQARVTAVSCASPGNCSAVGSYMDVETLAEHAFVVNQTRGQWGEAVRVPGITALNQLGIADLLSVSCASSGNCGAGGWEAATQGMVVSQVGGHWRKAQQIPHLDALNAGGYAVATSVSCASPGNCTAVGNYDDGSLHVQGFVVSEVRGIWRKAEPIPGLAALNTFGDALVTSVSCTSPGNCSAGGAYGIGAIGTLHAFVVAETNGHWGKARKVF